MHITAKSTYDPYVKFHIRVGIEPTLKAFAEPHLTTWLNSNAVIKLWK